VKLTLIEGGALTLVCTACGRTGTGGTELYSSASSGEARLPECWYQENDLPYCMECAAKLMEQDPTRSVNQFYTDTTGTEIRPENLPDL
jgi:hypothetical protein